MRLALHCGAAQSRPRWRHTSSNLMGELWDVKICLREVIGNGVMENGGDCWNLSFTFLPLLSNESPVIICHFGSQKLVQFSLKRFAAVHIYFGLLSEHTKVTQKVSMNCFSELNQSITCLKTKGSSVFYCRLFVSLFAIAKASTSTESSTDMCPWPLGWTVISSCDYFLVAAIRGSLLLFVSMRCSWQHTLIREF